VACGLLDFLQIIFGILKNVCTFAPPKLNSDEKNISALGKKTQEQAWFQGKNGKQERP
jgi:hypothetical protein